MSITKPMLASPLDDQPLRYPVLVSPKLDGIRCLCHPSLGPVSRKFLPIPNHYIREVLEQSRYSGFDGELVTYTNFQLDDFNTTQSKVMSASGEPDFVLQVFDDFTCPTHPFTQRFEDARVRLTNMLDDARVVMVPHEVVYNPGRLSDLYEFWLGQGYEGIMTRDPLGPYKEGRSTPKQQLLAKHKPRADAEGVVIGFVERQHNTNEATQDEVGHTKRSSAKAGLRPAGTLGALVLHTQWGTLEVGTGFSDALRLAIWREQPSYIGRTVTFLYQAEGMKDKPRFPTFKGFRDERDMS